MADSATALAVAPDAPEAAPPSNVPDATPDDLVKLLDHEEFNAAPYGQRIAMINQVGQGVVQNLQKQPDTNEQTADRFAELIHAAYEKAAPPKPQGMMGSLFSPIQEKEPAAFVGAAAGMGAAALAAPAAPETLGAAPVAADLAASAAASYGTQKAIDAVRGPVAARRAQEQLEANHTAHPFMSGMGEAVPFLTSMTNPVNWFKKAATTTAGKIGQRVVQSATGGARAGGIAASREYANGSSNLLDIPKEMIHSAATMAPLGFIGPAKNILMAMTGKAASEAAIAATSEALYQRVVNGKPLDLSEITQGAVSDVPGFILLNALSAAFHLRGKTDQAAKADDVNAINGVVQSAQPRQTISEKIKGIVGAYAGKTMSKTTARDRVAGELGARWISSKAASELAADAFTSRVLLESNIPVEKFGAALVEDNLRSIKDGLIAEGKPGDAAKVETLIGAKGSSFATESDYQAFLHNPAVKDALERHKQLWSDIVDPMFKSAAHLDPAEPLATRGKQTGARINLFNDPQSAGNVQGRQIQASIIPFSEGGQKSSTSNPVLQRMADRLADEEAGKATLHSLEADGVSPKEIVGTFWKDTWPTLAPAVQARFLKYLKSLTSFSVGDEIGVNKDGSPITARKASDLYPAEDAPDQIRHLEGTERGLITLMLQANEGAGQMRDVSVQPSSSEESSPSVTPSAFKRATQTLSKTRIGKLLLRRIQIVPDWQRAIQLRSFSPEEMNLLKRAEGFHDPQTGKSVVIVDNIKPREGEAPEQAAIRVITHELEGHERHNWMRAHDARYNRKYLDIARKIPQAELDALASRYPHLKANPDGLALEWFAQQAERLGLGELPDPQSLLGQLWQAIKDFLKRNFGQEKGLDQAVRRLIVEGRRTPESLEGGGGAEEDVQIEGSQPQPAKYQSTGAPSGRLTNTFRRKSPFARAAKGTGRSYNVNYAEMMRNTFARQLEIANKNAFEKRLVETGNAVEDRPNQLITLEGEATKAFPLNRTMVIQQDGQSFNVAKNIYVRQSLAAEYERAADVTGKDIPYPAQVITNILNHSALTGLTDGTVHVTNLLSALMTRPGASAGVLGDTMLSALGRADVPVTIFKVIAKAFQDNKLQVAHLAEIGAMKGQGPHTSWFFLSRWLGNTIQKADKVTRLVLDDMFTNMAKKGYVVDTETNRREFINQVGQYNHRAQGALKRAVRKWGVGPFVTAGTTFNTLGFRTLALRSGAEATSKASSALLGINVLSKWIGASVVVGTLNYLLTKDKGGGAFGRPGIPLGRIDTGLNDENGNPLSFPFFDLMGLGRGLRATGIRGFVEAKRKGLNLQNAVDSAGRDVFNSNTSPFFGPVVRFGAIAASGYQPAVNVPRESPVVAPGDSQVGQNFKTALVDANPILKSFVLSQQPGQGWLAALHQQLPRFSLVPSQNAEMMQDYPAIVRRAQATQFIEDVIGRARKMNMSERTAFVNESINRLDPADRAHALRTIKMRKVFTR